MLGVDRRFVYVLRSESNPACQNVGVAENVEERARLAQRRSMPLHATASPVAYHAELASVENE